MGSPLRTLLLQVQVAMESNGKGVDLNGQPLPYKAGEVDFGEPGTNGQHSFYQLIHQGRPVPAEFIGVVRSQQSVYLKGEIVSNHDELMCNFFAQADALAVGKSPVELRSENVPDSLIPHKTFTGNRPSMSIMLPELNAYTVGQLLALYENRVAAQVRRSSFICSRVLRLSCDAWTFEFIVGLCAMFSL